MAPVPAVLVGCGNGAELKYNLLTVAWVGTVCSDPPMLAIALRPERFSYDLVSETGEFTVNLPGHELAAAVDKCGVISGRDCDKFQVCNLTPHPGTQVASPLVVECPVNLECRVERTIPLGSHTLFIGRILAVQVDSALISPSGKFDIDRAGLLAYAHGHYYELGRCIGHFGFSVRKKPGPRVRK